MGECPTHTRIYASNEVRVKKLATTQKNILWIAIVALTITALVLSIVLPLTLRADIPTLETTTPPADTVLPTPSDTVTSDSVLKYAAGHKQFDTHVVSPGLVESDYAPATNATELTNENFYSDYLQSTAEKTGNYLLTEDITISDSAHLLAMSDLGSSAVFDGNGHTITISGSSLSATLSKTVSYNTNFQAGGLLAVANKGTIKNLQVVIANDTSVATSVAITSSSTEGAAYGILCGWNTGTIRNVSVTIGQGARVTFTANSDYVIGGIAGISSTSSAKIDYSKVTINGTLQAENGEQADKHVGVGGFVGRIEEGTYQYLHISGASTGVIGVNGADNTVNWKFMGGITGFDRATGGGKLKANTTSTPSFSNLICTYSGSFFAKAISSSGDGENYAGYMFGSGQARSYSAYNLYTNRSSDIGNYSGNITGTVTASSTIGIAGHSSFVNNATQLRLSADQAELGFTYSATNQGAFIDPTDTTWDGIVAVYSGDVPNISTTEIANDTNATISTDYGYVKISNQGNATFGWVERDEAVWPTNGVVAEVGTMPIGYQVDDMATPITSADDLENINLKGAYYLANDITLTVAQIAQFGLFSSTFAGILDGGIDADGNCHTITITGGDSTTKLNPSDNSIVYEATDKTAVTVGLLFGANSGIIRNLNVVNESTVEITNNKTVNNNVTKTNVAAGVLVGANTGTIKNVSVTSTASSSFTVNGNGSTSYPLALLGGVVGVNKGTITYVQSTLNGTLNTQTQGTASENALIGGIVGASSGGSISLAKVTGRPTISSTAKYFGGIMGTASMATTVSNVIYAVDASNIQDANKYVVAARAAVSVSGKVFNFSTITNYVATNGNDNLTKIIIDAQSSLLIPNFYYNNTDSFSNIVVDYPDNGNNVKATGFSDNLAGKYTYSDSSPKRVVLAVQSAGTYSWKWTQVLDEQGARALLASTGSSTTSLVMTGNVVLTGTESQPIYVNNHTLLAGSYIDGGGYRLSISGKVIVAPDATGILATNSHAEIRNLILNITSNITVSSSVFGLLVGTNNNNGRIDGVTVNGSGTITLTSSESEVYLGGVVGVNDGIIANVSSAITARDRLVATSTHATGTAYVGGIAGSNTMGVSASSVTVTTDGSIKAHNSYDGVIGGAVGTSNGGSITTVTVTNDGDSGGGIFASQISNRGTIGGIVGYTNGSINYSAISGGGNQSLGIINSSTATQPATIGGLVGRYSTIATLANGMYNIVNFRGSIAEGGNNSLATLYGYAFGTVDASSSYETNLFYMLDDITPIVGFANGATITYRKHKIDMQDVSIIPDLRDATSPKILVVSDTPVMGIDTLGENSTGVSYDLATSSAIITPRTTGDYNVYSWTWVTDYAGIVNYDQTVYYGSDYMTVSMPNYTDGWATDYGRIVAGYGVPSTATPISNSAELLKWLSITKEDGDDDTVLYVYRSNTAEPEYFSRAQYEYAYLAGNITISEAVFFNAQGVLDAGRTLDGAGCVIEATKPVSYSASGTQAEIFNPNNQADSDTLASLGLTNLGSQGAYTAVSSGLVAINKGTIKNVTYKVNANQYVGDNNVYSSGQVDANTPLNWIHGYIAGINTGIIENVNVDIVRDATFHLYYGNDTVAKSAFTYLIGGVTGYNYGGKVSYSSTNITGLLETSPKRGSAILGGVVGLANGGALEYLKLSGNGSLRMVNINGSSKDKYVFGGIVGAMENSSVSPLTVLSAANIAIRQSSLNYVYNQFTGSYVTTYASANAATSILQGVIAGRLATSSTYNANTNPYLNGIMALVVNNYYWAQPDTAINASHPSNYDNNRGQISGYNYTNINHNSGNSKLAFFGGLDSSTMNFFRGGGVYLDSVQGAANGYYDYWTRLDTDNNGFAIEFEKMAAISSITAQHKALSSSSNSNFASGSGTSTSNLYTNDYRVYASEAYLKSAGYSTGYFGALYIKPTYYSGTETYSSLNLYDAKLNDSGRSSTTSGTQITNSTRFPLSGDGDYYLSSNVTISSYMANGWSNGTQFTGRLFGNGYTITFSNYNGKTSSSPEQYQLDCADDANYAGLMFVRIGEDAKIYDLTINFQQHFRFYKKSGTAGNRDDKRLSVGAIAGLIDGDLVEIDNVRINMSGTIEANNGNVWNNNLGLTVGVLAGSIAAGTVSNVTINHTGRVYGSADQIGRKTYIPDISAGVFAGYAEGGSTVSIKNIILTGNGRIDTNYAHIARSGLLIGQNDKTSSSITATNIMLWSANYSMSSTNLTTGSRGSSAVAYKDRVVGGNAITMNGCYNMYGTTTMNFASDGYHKPTSYGYYVDADGNKIGYKTEGSSVVSTGEFTSGYKGSSISDVEKINGNNVVTVNGNLYMDGFVYFSDSPGAYDDNYMFKMSERYVIRNAHRGMIFWTVGDNEAYYQNSNNLTVTYSNSVSSNKSDYHGTYRIGQKSKIYLVDANGTKVAPADVINTRRYDGSANVTAVFDGKTLVPLYDDAPDGKQVYQGIKDAVTANLITATQAGAMTTNEQLAFLKNKYQYSYQIFDITGTTVLHYNNWDDGEEFVKPLSVSAEFAGSYSLSAPTQRTFNQSSYYYFDSNIMVLATSIDNSLSNMSNITYNIEEGILIASPSSATSWAEESIINFYIPRADDNAITRFVLYDDVQCTTNTIPINDIDEYTRATVSSAGGYGYVLAQEQMRNGTTYYVGAYKLNPATGNYVRVASTAIIDTKIDQYAPVIGVMRNGALDSNILPSDVTYAEKPDGTIEYGEIRLYVQDVSMLATSYDIYSTPVNVATDGKTTISVEEYQDGLIYTIRCYDSATFNFSATDELDRSTENQFTIDIVKPQLIVNDQLKTYTGGGTEVKYINAHNHELLVASINDNLTSSAKIKANLKWTVLDSSKLSEGSDIFDSANIAVLFHSDINGQCYDDKTGRITLPLTGVVCETARIIVWTTDDVGNTTIVYSNNNQDIIIDTREYIVRSGASLISEESIIAPTSRLRVTDTDGNSNYVEANSNSVVKLKRYDSFSVVNPNAGATGYTYIGYGVDVNYVNVANRVLDYAEERLEIGVSSSQTVTIDAGRYSGVDMTTEIKIVLFFTVALDLTMAVDHVVDLNTNAYNDVITAQGIAINRLVADVSRTINNVTDSSEVINSGNFLDYVDMIITREDDSILYNSSTTSSAGVYIPINVENSYSITFTVKDQAHFDKYYTINTTSAIYTLAVVNPDNAQVSFIMPGDTISLQYNQAYDPDNETDYPSNWDGGDDDGYRLQDILMVANKRGLLTFQVNGTTSSTFIQDYADRNGENLFESLKYTVLYNGTVYNGNYLCNVGTYNVTAQIKSSKGYTSSYSFAVVINKQQVTFRPYEQHIVYGYSIANNAYYVKWDEVAIRDKQATTRDDLRYETVDGVNTVYYIGANNIKIIVGTLNGDVVTIYGDNYDVISKDDSNKTLSISYWQFRDTVFAELPSSSTVQYKAGTYTDYNGIIMSGGSANNYRLYFTGQYAPKLVIDRRYITIKITNQTKSYNGDDPVEYTWSLDSGTFADGDGVTSFVTNLYRTYPADGVDEVGVSYDITGTVSNPNYNVTVIDGRLSIVPLKLNYYVSGTENMIYDGVTDYFGTLDVIVTNAKKSDNVQAKIYYLIGYSSRGSEDPVYVDKDLNALNVIHNTNGTINRSARTFRGTLTGSNAETVRDVPIAWINSGTYTYQIVATSTSPNFSTNYSNYPVQGLKCEITGYVINIVALDQIIEYGDRINNTNTVGTTYKLEGVANGDTVKITNLNIRLGNAISEYAVGKYAGVIEISGAGESGYTSALGIRYTFTFVYGNLTVEHKEIDIDWSSISNSQVYNGSDQSVLFTGGAKASESEFTDRLVFTYHNSSGTKVTSMIDAGGYYVRASLPLEYANNYKISKDTELFYVNIDKAPVTLKAFGNNAWNATTDTVKDTANYKTFASGSLATILSSSNLTLHTATGGDINDNYSRPAEHALWMFVVTMADVSGISHVYYGNGQNNTSLPNDYNMDAGTYEVLVQVPETANYYGVVQRVFFTINPSGGSNAGNFNGGTREATDHLMVSKESTNVNILNSSGIMSSGGGIPGGLSTTASAVSTGKVRYYNWICFYFNIELSDEYYMLAQQGRLTLRLNGNVSSQYWGGTYWNWNDSDTTAVIIRGIHDANDYRYGTETLGENGITANWNTVNIITNMTGLSNIYESETGFCRNHKQSYSSNFNLSFSAKQSAYRVYLLMAISEEEQNKVGNANNAGMMSSSFSGLTVTATISGTQSDYTMTTVDKSDSERSASNVYVPLNSSLVNTSSSPARITVGGNTYYFSNPAESGTAALYSKSNMGDDNLVRNMTLTRLSNYYKVQSRIDYNDNARAWRFTVSGDLGYNPQTFAIKVKPTRGSTEVWSVANGKVHIVSIAENYSNIVFETSILNDHKASLEELTIYDYKGNKQTLKERVILDNSDVTIGNFSTSTSYAGTYVAYDEDAWYKTPQYLTFDVNEALVDGYSGVDIGSVELYYYDASGVKKTLDLTTIANITATGSNLTTRATFRTMDGYQLSQSTVYYISAKDMHGNAVTYAINFHYDATDDKQIAVTTDPNVKLDSWYFDNVTLVTEVGIDLANGLATSMGKLQYLATDTDMYSNNAYLSSDLWRSLTLIYDSTTGKYYSTLDITKSSQKYYVFRFETGAGNYIYSNLGRVLVDKSEPTINVTVANTSTDNLVISNKWEKGSVTFTITGMMGISGGQLEYTSAGVNASTWYKEGSTTESQPATFTFRPVEGNRYLYTATLEVSTRSYIESNYAIRFTSGNGKVIYVTFGNGKNEFTLKIDNIAPTVTTDVIAWQSKPQEAPINVTENESGIGNVIIEEKLKGSDVVVAFFTTEGAYVGSYANYNSSTAKYIDKIYDIVRIKDASDFNYVKNSEYLGRVFKYVGDNGINGYATDYYYQVVNNGTYQVLSYNNNGIIPTVASTADMRALLTADNLDKYYRYNGESNSEFINDIIYKVVADGEASYRFKSVEEGETRTITTEAGQYYFKFDDRDYNIYVYDAVGNMAQGTYAPQVDSYEPTINVVAIQYDDATNVDFTYHETADLTGDGSVDAGRTIYNQYQDKLTKVYLNGDESATYYLLTTLEDSTYYAYVMDDSGVFVKVELPADKVQGKESFTITSATPANQALLSSLRIESIAFYPQDARLQVKTMDGVYGDGVDANHVYQYATGDNTDWTTKKVKFILTRWTSGLSGGTLYASNGVQSSVSAWQTLKTITGANTGDPMGIELEVSAQGAKAYTFFFRSTSNIMVYYNYVSHKSETKNNTAEIAGRYAFMVKIDTTAPTIGKPEYRTVLGNYDQTIENKQDWWTSSSMDLMFRFTLEDVSPNNVTKSGIDISSIMVKDSNDNIIPLTDKYGTTLSTIQADQEGYYYFVVKEKSTYTIYVSDMVGNSSERIITQYGNSDILVDTVEPAVDVTTNLDSVSIVTADGFRYANQEVVFYITATYGASGATVFVERRTEEGAWVAYDASSLVQDEVDPTRYSISIAQQMDEDLELRFGLTNGANVTRYFGTTYTFRLDSVAPEVSYDTYLHGTTTSVDITGVQWHDEAVDVYFTITDVDGSGILSVACYHNGVELGEDRFAFVNGRYVLKNVDDASDYYLKVVDQAGNVLGDATVGQKYYWNIDARIPTIEDFTVTSNGVAYNGGYSSTDVIVTFTVGFAVKDKERTGDVEWSIDGGQTFTAFSTTDQNYTKSEATQGADGVYYYTISYTYRDVMLDSVIYRAKSQAFKVSENTTPISIYVDSVAPTISAEYLVDGNVWDFDSLPWATGDVVVNITASVGIFGGKIIVYKDGTATDTVIPWTNQDTSYQYTIPATTDVARYTFKVVKDNVVESATTSATTEEQLVQFDVIEPDIDVTSAPYVMGSWTNQNVTINVTLTMGASYKKTSFYATLGGIESLVWTTEFNPADGSYKFLDAEGNTIADADAPVVGAPSATGVVIITFAYVVVSQVTVNPVVQTNVEFKVYTGNGKSALDSTFAERNSIQIDTFAPKVTVERIFKVDTDVEYTYNNGAWSWQDGAEWSNKQVRMVFSMTYYASGGTLKYSENNGALTSAQITYSKPVPGEELVGGTKYISYTVQCTLTIGTDKASSYRFVAESSAGTSSSGHQYYNGATLETANQDFSIAMLKIDMTNPSIPTVNYYREDKDGNYKEGYNPEVLTYVTDEKVLVTFVPEDVSVTNNIASGIATVTMTTDGVETLLTANQDGSYSFYVNDCDPYVITVTDHSGRTSSRTIEIGVDSVKPELTVTVIGGEDGVKGYAIITSTMTEDEKSAVYDDLDWLTEQMIFSFNNEGTKFGSSDGFIFYSQDKLSWTRIGTKNDERVLSDKITYSNRLYFKAQSKAGLESDIVEIILKLDLKEYGIDWLQKVESYQGSYSDVTLDKYPPYKRDDKITVTVEPYSGYTFNYVMVNSVKNEVITLDGTKASFTVEVTTGKDIALELFYKEEVTATYTNTTQYLKYQNGAYGTLTTPVYVRNSHGDMLTTTVSYRLADEQGNPVGAVANDVSVLGKSDTYPIGNYVISVALANDSHYTLRATDSALFEVRYFRQAGTQDDPYLIDNEIDLQYINTTIYDSADAYFAFVNDIVLSTQINVGDFRGILDGRNYKLTLSTPLQQLGLDTTPIFGRLSGTVQNIGFELGETTVAVNGNYESSSLYYGFLARELSGTVRDSYVVSDMTFVETNGGTLAGNLYIGGLIGRVTSGKIINTFTDAYLDVRGLVNADSIAIGGLVGSLIDLSTLPITDSFSIATIYAGQGVIAGMLAPTNAVNSLDIYNNRVVDDNIYRDGVWTGVTGNATYYQLITRDELGNTLITKSTNSGRAEPKYVLNLASYRYSNTFEKAPTFDNGNLCFEISTAEEFARINDFLWADYKQVRDIEISDTVIALGSVFRGVYDGGDYTLTINNTTNTSYGLFDRVSGTIKNLQIQTGDDGFVADVTNAGEGVVALFVKDLVGGTIDQVVIGGDFEFNTALTDKFTIGALVGNADNATITDVVSTIYISANGVALNVGAIVGSANNTYIDNVYAVSTVNTSYTGSASVGAIVGTITGTTTASYYYDETNVYNQTPTGKAIYTDGILTALNINGNVIKDVTKFGVDNNILTYNDKEYVIEGEYFYPIIGSVEMAQDSNTIRMITIDGKQYPASRISTSGNTVTINGEAYAFTSNTYVNGTTRDRIIGLDRGDKQSDFTYKTLDDLVGEYSTAIIAPDKYVRDSLYAMYQKEFDQGVGTAINPFILSDKSDFKKISRYMYAHYKIVLPQGVSSLTFEDGEWETIGVGMNFTGSITAESTKDNLGYPQTVKLYGIQDTFIDKNYGTISNFILVVDINKITAQDTVFGVVANENYGTIKNIEVSGEVTVMIQGGYTLIAGGLVGKSDGGVINSADVKINATYRAQSVIAGVAVGSATAGTTTNTGLASTIQVLSATGKCTLGAYVGEQIGTATINQKANGEDVKHTVLIANGNTLDNMLIGNQP